MIKVFRIGCFLLMQLSFLYSQVGYTGGPISVVPSTGESSVWISPVSLHPEAGLCGSFSNAEMIQKLDQNISYWENISGSDLSFIIEEGGIGVDVDHCNYITYFVDSSDDPGLDDSLNPVVFDDDGAIVTDLFGTSAKFTVLGFAGPDGFTSDYTTIVDGQAFFNCRCLTGNAAGACPAGVVFTEDDLNFTMTHEIGHKVGLDHSQVNQNTANGNCDLDVTGDCDDVLTMYPQAVDSADQITPHRDDEVAFLTLYGLTHLTNSSCTVTGHLVDVNGDALRCADVQAETGDTADTISAISGANAIYLDINGDGYSDGSGECLSNCGYFALRGLDPGETYTITVKPINSSWVRGSSVGPCVNGQISGIVEEVIATVRAGSCAAGSSQDLGTVVTSSTGGIQSGNPGINADFYTNNELVGRFAIQAPLSQTSCGGGSGGGSSGCSLIAEGKSAGWDWGVLFLVFAGGFVFKRLYFMRNSKSKMPNTG